MTVGMGPTDVDDVGRRGVVLCAAIVIILLVCVCMYV